MRYVGPLQDMLNHERRREVFASVSFELLRVSKRLLGLVKSAIVSSHAFCQLQDCVFADENVVADTETAGGHPLLLLSCAYCLARACQCEPRFSACSAGGLCILGAAEKKKQIQIPGSELPPSAASSASPTSLPVCC